MTSPSFTTLPMKWTDREQDPSFSHACREFPCPAASGKPEEESPVGNSAWQLVS